MEKKITINIELPIIGEVEFWANESDFYLECDGIGAYEFAGHSGYDFGNKYIEVNTILWDYDRYAIFDNKLIEKWINENAGTENCPYKKLCEAAEYLFEEQSEHEIWM